MVNDDAGELLLSADTIHLSFTAAPRPGRQDCPLSHIPRRPICRLPSCPPVHLFGTLGRLNKGAVHRVISASHLSTRKAASQWVWQSGLFEKRRRVLSSITRRHNTRVQRELISEWVGCISSGILSCSRAKECILHRVYGEDIQIMSRLIKGASCGALKGRIIKQVKDEAKSPCTCLGQAALTSLQLEVSLTPFRGNF